ncbi:MAG: ribonuclease J [Rickettsiales bacterium]|jgi:ribonuclease J|nr:ribonuclease J [Rickettsiales bacterium]
MTDINFARYKDDLLFLPLGGSGEVTMNCNLYHYKGKWIIVDMGIQFVKNLPGIEIMLPDVNFIKKNIKDFLGIFITHVHEDHIGALQYLWADLKLPIYASKFAVQFMKNKFAEYEWGRQVKYFEVPTNGIVTLNPFIMEFIGLTHSIPEMNAILIRTEKGNILHTGDWRFEEKPIIGVPTNKQRLKELGDKNKVLAMVCESTNIFSDKVTKNEAELLDSLKEIIKENSKGLVVCGIFATHISRIVTLAIAGKACGRKIGVLGGSLYRSLRVAKEMNYLPRDLDFVPEEEFNKYDKRKLLIISTGCQGQENSGLGRLADDTYKNLKLEKDDTVIFSSSEIPGNEIDIGTLYNKFAEKGVNIVNSKNAFVHLSGHYTRSELKEMYELVRPLSSITTHGEPMQLIEHKKVAEEMGVKNVAIGNDGSVLKLNEKGKIDKIGDIKVLSSVMDGNRRISVNNTILTERAKLEEAGIIIVNFVIDKTFKQLAPVDVVAVGNYNLANEKVIHQTLRDDANKGYKIALSIILNPEFKETFDTFDKQEFKIMKEVKRSIENFVYQNMNKMPFVVVNMLKETKDLLNINDERKVPKPTIKNKDNEVNNVSKRRMPFRRRETFEKKTTEVIRVIKKAK